MFLGSTPPPPHKPTENLIVLPTSTLKTIPQPKCPATASNGVTKQPNAGFDDATPPFHAFPSFNSALAAMFCPTPSAYLAALDAAFTHTHPNK